MRCSRLALAALATAALTMPAAAAYADGGHQTVSYHGYRIQVPADWKVVDLDDQPNTCVRFDRPTVYLGTPGATSDCPAGLVGRTAGIRLEPVSRQAASRLPSDVAQAPAGSATPQRLTSEDGQIQFVDESAGLVVTGVHTDKTEQSVRDVLASASLTDQARPGALPQARSAAEPQTAEPQPGTLDGDGFDACAAPDQAQMDDWKANSPYAAVGVYISGDSRACDQPNLTPQWVSAQLDAGWHLILIEVGKQAPCSDFSDVMSTDPATARTEGSQAAKGSIAAAQQLGLPAGSVIYNDVEGYDSTASCKASVLSYLSGWTDELHQGGFKSGLYSGPSSGVGDAAAEYDNPDYTRVDQIWFAWWNKADDTDLGSYAPADVWADHQRMHQYLGGHDETYGSTTINIDNDKVDVAVPPAA